MMIVDTEKLNLSGLDGCGGPGLDMQGFILIGVH